MKSDSQAINIHEIGCRYTEMLIVQHNVESALRHMLNKIEGVAEERELSDALQTFAQALNAFGEACLEARCSGEIGREVRLCLSILEGIGVAPRRNVIRTTISISLLDKITQEMYDTLLPEGL